MTTCRISIVEHDCMRSFEIKQQLLSFFQLERATRWPWPNLQSTTVPAPGKKKIQRLLKVRNLTTQLHETSSAFLISISHNPNNGWLEEQMFRSHFEIHVST